jgi:hypothetical protein
MNNEATAVLDEMIENLKRQYSELETRLITTYKL